MGDGDSRSDSGRLWRGLRAMVFGDAGEATLRDQIAEVLDDHEDDPAPDAQGDLSPVERQMVRNLLRFGRRTARDVAVPRSVIIGVPESLSFAELVKAFADAGHSRLPVYRDNLDKIIGMIHIKDVFAILASGAKPPAEIAALMRKPLVVVPSADALALLAQMRSERMHLAIVIDENGGTEGMITIEDIVEEIVGNIEDEHDDAPDIMLAPLEGGMWDADARAELDEVAATVDPRLHDSDGDVTTIGGLAFLITGHVPQIGDRLAHESGWTLEIVDADARGVKRLRLHPPVTVEIVADAATA